MPRERLPDLSIVLLVLRESMGWRQTELGEVAGISPNIVNDYERGRKTLTRRRLEHLISFMGLRPERIDALLAELEADGLAAGKAAHQALAVRCHGDHRRGQPFTFGIRDHRRLATLEGGDNRVGGPQVDPYGLGHLITSSKLGQVLEAKIGT